MSERSRSLLSITIVALLAFTSSSALADNCVSGTITAQYVPSGPFAGLYKYTVVVTWTTEQGLSNIAIDCGFGQCPLEACGQIYAFESPAGSGDGDGCGPAEFYGEFNCEGNPSIGFTDPVIKWDVLGECEAGTSGTATLCFYTNLGPHPDAQLPATLIKNGQNVCEGSISGDCPAPPCVVPVDEINWGKLKGWYR